jgi:hypothetical protein
MVPEKDPVTGTEFIVVNVNDALTQDATVPHGLGVPANAYDVEIALRINRRLRTANAYHSERTGFVVVRADVLNLLVTEYDQRFGQYGFMTIDTIIDRIREAGY